VPTRRTRETGFLAVERVVEAPTGLWVIVRQEADGSISRHALPRFDVLSEKGSLHHDVVERALLADAGDGATAHLPADVVRLAGSVRATVNKLEVRFLAALEQRADDLAAAEALYAKWRASPDSFPPADRTFQQNCATCHGATGRVIGPNVTRLAVRPRNLADGLYMNALPDEHLATIIRYGGAPMRHSGLMPGFGSAINEKDLAELVKHIRKLAVPPYTEGPHAHSH